jgi:hypothetical protein
MTRRCYFPLCLVQPRLSLLSFQTLPSVPLQTLCLPPVFRGHELEQTQKVMVIVSPGRLRKPSGHDQGRMQKTGLNPRSNGTVKIPALTEHLKSVPPYVKRFALASETQITEGVCLELSLGGSSWKFCCPRRTYTETMVYHHILVNRAGVRATKSVMESQK